MFFNSTFIPKEIDCSTDDGFRAEFGIGIFATNSGFTVNAKCIQNGPFEPCYDFVSSEFSGLGFGIHSNTISTNRSVRIMQSNFENCYVGIHIRNTDGVTIIHNQFNMGALPNTECVKEEIGVSLKLTIEGISFQENQFIDNVGNDEVNSIGTLSTGIGNFNNRIRRNSFDGLDFANIAAGFNASFDGSPQGLFYECNTMSNIGQYDFLVSNTDIFPVDNIRKTQGLIIDPSIFDIRSAGNKFSYSGVPDDSDFRNEFDPNVPNASLVDYFYNPNGQNETPIESFNITTMITTGNDCLVEFCPPPCELGPMDPNDLQAEKSNFHQRQQDYLIAKSDYEAAMVSNNDALANQKKIEGSYALQERDKSYEKIMQYLMTDTTTYDDDSLRIWIGILNTYSADLALALNYTETGNWDEAYGVLNSAPSKFNLSDDELIDLEKTIQIFEILEKKTLYLLDNNDINALMSFVDEVNGNASPIARSILELYKVRHYDPIYKLPSQKSDEDYDLKIGDNGKETLFKSQVKLKPNPADDYIVFSIENIFNQTFLRIYNTLGVEVKNVKLISNQSEYSLDINGLESGVYYYQLISNNKRVRPYSGKFIIHH